MGSRDTLSVCIHAHFYQPPRENPWSGTIAPQPSAAPYRDWNARVSEECYGPNAWARLLDAHGAVLAVSNNYSRMSFNFGPTLLCWLEAERPSIYRAIVRADALGRARHDGAGPALAQVYHHVIMPLATARDKRTQVAWGARDFAHRFGRAPQGMWLAETAVDLDTLEALAERGVCFTILAPHQAARTRPIGEGAWHEVEAGSLDTSRAYLQRLPSGRQIVCFFYDGPTSRAIAFEGVLHNGERFARRLIGRGRAGGGGLSHVATDGESYGHHHRHGEMALAYTTRVIERSEGVELTYYEAYLREHAPEQEVQIEERTSWSCMHGVERWRSACGCRTGGPPEAGQAWRAPLREALDGVREALTVRAERERSWRDVWGARDRYIEVRLGTQSEQEFCEREAIAGVVSQARRARMVCAMEMLRHGMLMYTSCGWFFYDLAGIETLQVLSYAGRALEHLRELSEEDGVEAERAFLSALRGAVSHDGRSGADLFEEHVRPFMGLGDRLRGGAGTRAEALNARFELCLAAWIERPSDRLAARATLKALEDFERRGVRLEVERCQVQALELIERLGEQEREALKAQAEGAVQALIERLGLSRLHLKRTYG